MNAASIKPKVILSEHLDPIAATWLEKHVNLIHCSHEDVTAFNKHLATAQALIVRTYTQVTPDLLDLAPILKVVARAGVGLDNIDLPECKKNNITVVYTPDANTQAVVEYTIALILDAIRPRHTLTQYVPPPIFHQLRADNVGKQLDTLTLGILGLGRIGRRVAQVAHAIGIRVIYNDLLTRRKLNLPDDQPGEFVDTNTLFKQSDILTIHVDGRPSNNHLINSDSLEKLKPSALLINNARGFLIDPIPLATWAANVADKGGKVILDVHTPEPPPDDYPLFNHPNIRLLPHLASRTHTAMLNMSWVVRDVVKVLNNQPPKYPAT